MSATKIWDGYKQAWKDHTLFLVLLVTIVTVVTAVILVIGGA